MTSCNSTPSAPRASHLGPRFLYQDPKRLGTAQIERAEHNHLQNRGWQGSISRAFAVTFMCSGLLLVLVTFTPMVSWWNKLLTGNIRNGSGEELIVLGAAPPEYGILPESSYLRSAFAVKLYHQHKFREIIIVGGDHTALSMADFLESQGIPREILRVETRSASTRENALYVRPFLDASSGPPVVLTSDFHMFRTQRVFRRLGMKILSYPVPDADRKASRWWSRWSAFIDVSTETSKIAYYFLRGWI
jgi:vancomycin permeability regulator SanA